MSITRFICKYRGHNWDYNYYKSQRTCKCCGRVEYNVMNEWLIGIPFSFYIPML